MTRWTFHCKFFGSCTESPASLSSASLFHSPNLFFPLRNKSRVIPKVLLLIGREISRTRMSNHPPPPPNHSRPPLPRADNASSRSRRALAPLVLLLQLHTSAAQNDAAVRDPTPDPDPDPYGQRFNPSIAIIMVVLFSALFIMGFFSVYLRQCAERRFRGPSSDQLEGQFLFRRGQLRGAAGIDASVIQSFPTFQYSSVKGLKIGKGSLECAVCLNEFEDDDALRLLPSCNHVFHSNCIDAWLSSHTTCPVCRANLVPKPGEKFDASIPQAADPEPSTETRCPPDQVHICLEPDHNVANSNSQSPQAEEGPSTNKSRSPRPGSAGMRVGRLFLFPRSHSTGHSLVLPGEDRERLTLRLPDHVRDQIIKSAGLNRAKSGSMALPRARSAKAGYRRSESNGGWRSIRERYYNYERFDQVDGTSRWGFSVSPLFIGKTGPARSPRGLGDDGMGTSRMTPPRSTPKPEKSQLLDRLFLGVSRDDGERSPDRPRAPDCQV